MRPVFSAGLDTFRSGSMISITRPSQRHSWRVEMRAEVPEDQISLNSVLPMVFIHFFVQCLFHDALISER